MSEVKDMGGRVVIDSLEDINKYIEKNFPDGLQAKRVKGDEGTYLGYRLNRYAYTDRAAAECHAMRDIILDNVGQSYGCPFESYVKTVKSEDHSNVVGEEWHIVFTGPYQDAPA
jgi:hypothetical protein